MSQAPTPELPPAIAAMRATRGGAPWRPPTRRTFLALLGLGGVALGARPFGKAVAAPAKVSTRPVRWIGHC